jgi:hypothetical protein
MKYVYKKSLKEPRTLTQPEIEEVSRIARSKSTMYEWNFKCNRCKQRRSLNGSKGGIKNRICCVCVKEGHVPHKEPKQEKVRV